MNENIDLIRALRFIDPSELSYSEWTAVGMALKHEGYSCADWDEWSRNDSRYHVGECERKWNTFRGTSVPVTGGTIIQMAKDRGYRSYSDTDGYELDWNGVIGGNEGVLYSDSGWLEGREVQEPEHWNPVQQLITYLETLFDSTENVGFVTKSWERDGKYMPSKGNYDRTAGELIQELHRCKGDIGAVLGDYNSDVGAWIRFNPLDGKGVKNENVTDYRYALVESDHMELDKQNALLRELELPIAAMVYSGGKSIHAIVKIGAATYEEYRKRVDFLYSVLKKNGLEVDTQNKNPSRLSRMPGVMRNGKKQFLMDIHIGKSDFNEWKEWIESLNDDLPDPDNLSSVWQNLPQLAPPLIDNILRQGHKMLIAGPSKAGKSYLLIELCCAIAEGRKWLNWQCTQGKVLYVNLELDRASCLHRFKDIYDSLGWRPDNISNIDIWNLRGRSVPMDKLAPKLIRRALKKNYITIVIDPIYKVITGDENSADQMAAFCNQFDKVCTELGASVIYCHHHSKGAQGGKKSMDRASGSGVFARDPDALLDILELELTDDVAEFTAKESICKACVDTLKRDCPTSWQELFSQDDALSASKMLSICEMKLCASSYGELQKRVEDAKKAAKSRTAWRIEGTLREFPKFAPVNLWFEYPKHSIDTVGILEDMHGEEELTPWQKKCAEASRNGAKKRRDQARHQRDDMNREFDTIYGICSAAGDVTAKDIMECYIEQHGIKYSMDTIYRRIKNAGYKIDKNTGVVDK